MPIDQQGHTVLSFWKGITCWACILVWIFSWWLIAVLTQVVWFLIVGASLFGVVPMLFFWHEDYKLKEKE